MQGRQCERCLRGELCSQSTGARQQIGGRNNFVHQADSKSFCSINHGAGEQQLERSRGPDQPRQALGATIARDQPQLGFRQAQPRVTGRQTQLAAQSQLAAPTQREAIDAGDHRFAAGFDKLHHCVTAMRQSLARSGIGAGQLGDVGPRGKGLLSCTGDQDHANRRIGCDQREDCL